LPPLPAEHTQTTSALAHYVALATDNVAQSTSALVDSDATTTGLDAALAIHAHPVHPDKNIVQLAALLLTLAQAVRKSNVPSFLCQLLCI
jgi:hypothetical protein